MECSGSHSEFDVGVWGRAWVWGTVFIGVETRSNNKVPLNRSSLKKKAWWISKVETHHE